MTSATEAARAVSGRPMRADAQRNRERILRAAEAVLAVSGVGVGVDQIAAEAGVGIGTLYRHFPTKEALFEAIMVDRMSRVVAQGRAYLAQDPAQGLFQFMGHLVAESLVKRDLADALAKGTEGPLRPGPEMQAVFDDLLEVTAVLLVAAQEAGAVRGDVGPADLVGLVMGPCVAAENPMMPSCSPQVMLDVVCAGLRPAPARG